MNGVTMSYELIGATALVVHSPHSPSSEDWSGMLRELEQHCQSKQLKAMLVYSMGGGPNPSQRKSLADIMDKHPGNGNVAIITPSATVRTIVGLINWITRRNAHRAFAPSEFDAAREFLGKDCAASVSLRARIDAQLDRMVKAAPRAS